MQIIKHYVMQGVLLFGGLTLANHGSAQANDTAPISDADRAAASAPLNDYLKANATGDGSLIRQIFHKDAQIIGLEDGKMVSWSVKEFSGFYSGKPPADEALRKRSFKIISLTGDAAVGVVVLDYPTVKYTDHMNLLKINGQWKIVNKTFNTELK
jgi:Putative lumazine-binding